MSEPSAVAGGLSLTVRFFKSHVQPPATAGGSDFNENLDYQPRAKIARVF